MTIGGKYTEKRNFRRLPVNTEFTFTVNGTDNTCKGHCKNLSHTGISFITEHPLSSGQSIEVSMATGNEKFPPMEGTIEVIRADQIENNMYNVAGKIIKIK